MVRDGRNNPSARRIFRLGCSCFGSRGLGVIPVRQRFIGLSLAIAAVGFLVAGCGQTSPSKPITHKKSIKHVVKPKPKPIRYASPTTGMPEKSPGGQFFAVTVENSPQARPQTGLASADIVYEMETEGTITRYLALFHDHIPPLIGPVRSARPYFVTTAEDWGAPFVHFGGSPQAYQMLSNYPYHQIDGVTGAGGKYFSRDPSRVAPHNAYLHTDRLPTFQQSVLNGHFKFGQPPLAGTKSVSTLSIVYNSFTRVKYDYQKGTDEYLRYQDGQPDLDKGTGKQIYTNNVIVQYAPMAPIPNGTHGHISINLNGPGLALYFTMGKEIAGTWQRNPSGKVVYYDAQGKMITLHPGKTWIEVVDDSVPVTETK